jgi:hypothetical protein
MMSSTCSRARELAQLREETLLRQHHADVGHDRLGDHRRRATAGEYTLDRRQIVERHGVGARADIMIHADETGARPGAGFVLHIRHGAHQCLFDRAVIAATNTRMRGRPAIAARPTQRRAIGIGGRLTSPARTADQTAWRELLTDSRHPFRRQHRGDADCAPVSASARAMAGGECPNIAPVSAETEI